MPRHIEQPAARHSAPACLKMRSRPSCSAWSRTRAELEDHVATLLTDLGQALVLLEEDGPDAAANARDGGDVQGLLAERHGLQRCRLGWSEEALKRDYQILREEVEVALQSARDMVTDEAVDEAAAVIQRLLACAEEISLTAYELAQTGT